jgi:energy-coupling factor transporter ATP-binding protein EcfA2
VSVTALHPAGPQAHGPAATRFRLERAGLVGLYEYEDETFEFERGRLLLRGPNGAGKSKALELLLPLLLDGELRAERLDPFDGRGRSMRWNLIGAEESRAPATGFSWLELHRVDEQGVERFVTLVLMTRADKGESGVKSWFAVLEAERPPGGELRGPRIGISASLTAGRTPLTKRAFAELAGGLIESASDYRERVNTALFGVAQDRYEAVVRLLLSLRKPQLSQTLDPRELSERLTEALPELDRDAVLRVSARLDQLDALREEAATLREVREAVAKFGLTYRDWARAALRERGSSLEMKVREAELRRRALQQARAALAAAHERRGALARHQQELDEALAAARAAERELRSDDAWRDAERLDELRRRAEHAERELASAERALSRALEGAGLLDAWVMPDGLVLDADDALPVTGDASAQPGATLGRALVPVSEAPVPADVIAGVLARVALHDTVPGWEGTPCSGPQAAAVADDGGFALGPLRGRHRVDAARFIGAAARAANRERRLAELAALLAELDGRDRVLAGEAVAAEAALDLLADELRRLPDDTDAVRAHEQLRRARAEERRAAEQTASEQTAMTARAQERERARAAAAQHAREHALPAPEDAHGLQAVREALADYRGLCREALDAERVHRDFDAQAAAAAAQAERFAEVLAAATERRQDAAQEQSARTAAHRQAVEAVGASVEALRARLAELETAAAQVERGLREVQSEKEEAAAAEARAGSEADHAEEEVALAESAVAGAHAALGRLGGLGAWGLALGGAAPEGHERSAQWPLDRTLTALRAVTREALATRRGWQTLMGDVETEADQLRHRLSGKADFLVARQRVPEDPELTRVEVRHSGQARSIAALERWLEEELDARERAMADEDRRLFESFLVGGLADSLRERIGGARALVATMNDALAGCSTSSGMGIELEWRAREHDDPALREAVALLARDVALLGDEARTRLVEFLRRRIEDARHSLEQGSSTEHVMGALDYRNWHEFRVIQVRAGRREVLTRRRHQQGSGGEKAVALHLPLFAAAAAQFATARPEAPRMILLDEAFAGIDERMRAQLVGLLERFDLDFVLTSHELWGCYPECSALGIYHLHREPGIPGVATAHFRWNGERRIEVVDTA